MIKCCKNCAFYKTITYSDITRHLCILSNYYERSLITGKVELRGESTSCTVMTASGGECGPNLRKFLQKKPWWRFW